jgi:hypothetical protein
VAKFYISGTLSGGCYVWLMNDSGSEITEITGIPSSVIPAIARYMAAAPTIGGGLFVATETNIYKVKRDTHTLDTTWATNGIYGTTAVVKGLAVNADGYLAVALAGATSYSDVLVLDDTGTLVWSNAYSGASDKGSAIGFRADNGNVLYAKYFTGASPCVLELSYATGALIATYGNDGAAYLDIYRTKYISGTEPIWFSRIAAASSQVVSAAVGVMTSTDFTKQVYTFDVGDDGNTIITGGPN